MAAKRRLKYSIYVSEDELNRIRLYGGILPHTQSIQDILRAKVLEEVDNYLSTVEFSKVTSTKDK